MNKIGLPNKTKEIPESSNWAGLQRTIDQKGNKGTNKDTYLISPVNAPDDSK